jgi:hypothetical protein
MTEVFQAPDDPKTLKAETVALNAIELVDEGLLVDFNKVVQESLDRVKEQLSQLNAIIRCDNLPHVQAKAEDMRQLSNHLVRLILLHPPQKSKLFIYLKCNRFDSEVLPVKTSAWLHSYEICFHTNSCNEASWQSEHQQEIAECAAICAQYSGTFTAAYGHAESLFKLTLPGKLF